MREASLGSIATKPKLRTISSMLCGLALCLSIHSEVIYTIARGYHEHVMNSDICSRGGGGPYALGNPTLLFPHDAPQTPLTLQQYKLFGRMWESIILKIGTELRPSPIVTGLLVSVWPWIRGGSYRMDLRGFGDGDDEFE
jgi:hypothetical protein